MGDGGRGGREGGKGGGGQFMFLVRLEVATHRSSQGFDPLPLAVTSENLQGSDGLSEEKGDGSKIL